jgi:predicted DNA-binding transcriptional regulator YafY
MRAERLLSILMLLQRHRQLTAHDLAQRLEVSERTIYRDLEALSAAGIPLYAERGVGGGWFLPEEYRSNLPALSAEELQALILVNPQRLLADLGLQQVAERAMNKLVAGLPTRSRHSAAQAWQRLHVDFSGWNRTSEQIPQLPILQQAVWQERKTRLFYQRADGETVERLVEPLGLVAKGNVWYLVAAVEGEPRTYRVSRVRWAELTDEEFMRPSHFDLATYWGEAEAEFKQNLPRFSLRLRAEPEAVPKLHYAGRYSRVEKVGEPEADGWVPVQMLFELREDALAVMLGFGPSVEVVEPADLRAEIIEMAQQTVAHYARRGVEPFQELPGALEQKHSPAVKE